MMFDLIGVGLGFFLGVAFMRLWQKYIEEDIDLLKAEANHICNRLDRALTELRQLNAKPDNITTT